MSTLSLVASSLWVYKCVCVWCCVIVCIGMELVSGGGPDSLRNIGDGWQNWNVRFRYIGGGLEKDQSWCYVTFGLPLIGYLNQIYRLFWLETLAFICINILVSHFLDFWFKGGPNATVHGKLSCRKLEKLYILWRILDIGILADSEFF